MGARGQGAGADGAQDLSLPRSLDVGPRQISQPRGSAGGARQERFDRTSEKADDRRGYQRRPVQGDRQGNPRDRGRVRRLRGTSARTRTSRTFYRRAGGTARKCGVKEQEGSVRVAIGGRRKI